MAEILSVICGVCATISADPIKREFGYLWNYVSNLEDLRQKVVMLKELKREVAESLEYRPYGHEPNETVKTWQLNVDEILVEATKVLQDKEKTMCFKKLCPNLILRQQLGKKAKNAAKKIVELQKEHVEFGNNLTIYTAPLSLKFNNEGYEAFESRRSTFKEIMVALGNPSINVILIWGMGGIGKTMLVKEVAKKAKEVGLFDNVVMADVSNTPNISEIQRQIAEDLGLKFEGRGSVDQSAHQLRQRLCDGKTSILVILGNIWKKLELEKVGIPLGCKLVLTSRITETLPDYMNAKTFEIGQLRDDEAWDLFQKRAGRSANDPELEATAIEVAKKCANLPLTIAAVATALKNKGLPTWEDAWRLQRMSNRTNIIGISAEAVNCLKLSYDYMEDEAAKSLFSLCCLFPEDHHISIQEILKYGKGLGLFPGITTLEEERNRVLALVDHLKAHSLLLDGYTTGFFRIHAAFRDVRISKSVEPIRNDILVVRNGFELREFTRPELENCVAMSLPSIDIRNLPRHGQGLQCPRLQLLLWLSKDQYSLKIPDSFFEGMERLKVLNLTNIDFSSLPSLPNSLSKYLQTLCLEKCKLPDLSTIGELENLEILSFRESDIKTLPTGIGKLTRLWLLDLSHCSNLNTIPSDVIASLSGLEELYMGNSFVKWETEGNASLDEFKHLSHLVALEIGITDANVLPEEFSFKMLKRYRIFVGDGWDWSSDYETSKTFKLKLNTSTPKEGINMLLGSTEVLYLDELNGTSNVLYRLDREGFPHLKHLHVQRSSEIKYVIKSTEQDPSCKAFPELESLFLFDLINLKETCHGQLPEGSFSKLKTVIVERCGSLKEVFRMSVAKSLLRLQKFEVDGCNKLELIFANNEADRISFPQLHSLKLKCLPLLVSFCAKARTNIHSLNYAGEIIPEGEPHIPTPFFNKKVAFQNLKLLNIECCGNLRSLFSPSIANDLVKLRALKIINCQMMEEIVEKEKGVEEEEIDKIVFRLLSYITLQDLPELRSFYPGDHTFECPSLQRLTIDGCPKIKKFTSTYKGLQVTIGEDDLNGPSSPLFDDKVAFPNLEFLMIENVDSLKEIWPSQLSGHFPFQNLTSLLVTTCQNLKHIFTTSIANSLVQLQELKMGNSGKVEEIVEKERVEEESMVRIVFPQLTSLHFWGLPKLNSFGQGIFISDWTSLKTLNVSGSDNVETLALELSRFEQSGGKRHVGTPTKQPLFLVDKVAFPNLEELELSSMSNMKESWIDQFHAASFGKLTILKVRDCDSLTHLLSLTIAKSLVQIKRIIIENCNMMKEVVASNEREETVETTFSQLISLQLIKLPNLRSFWARSNTFSFLSLEEVLVEECPKMKTFCNGKLKTPKLEKVHTQFGYRGEVFDKGIWKGDLNTTIQYMFEQKVEFLRLSKLSELKQICHDQFPVKSCVVQYLVVEKCTSLLNVVSSNMLESLRKLETITVESCYSLKQVFDLEGLNYEEKHDGLLSNLEEMNLTELPKLRCIWNKDPEGILSFRNLRRLNICGCRSLRNMFSPSMVPYLTGLEELIITGCRNMEEIIGKAKGAKEEAIDKIELYSVYIVLQDLPGLTSFYPGNHTLRCPRLKTLKIVGCPRIKTFTSTNEGLQESIGDGNVDVPSAPLFIDKVAFPCLEDLVIDSVCLKEIWHSQLPVDSFCKLKYLKLERCNHLLNIVPSNMVKMLQNIVTLSVSYCGRSLAEESWRVGIPNSQSIVLSNKAVPTPSRFLGGPSSGSISSFLNPFTQEPGEKYDTSHFKGHTNFRQGDGSLEYIFDLGGQNDAEGHVVQDTGLSYLYLYNLPSLRHIWKMDSKGLFNFENLISVQVQLCENLRNIFTTSIATTLKQLQVLEIERCGVEDIVRNEGVEAAATVKTIVLPQLISLSLISLWELRSFCQGNIYISEWKSLKKLVVSACSEVEIFASNSISFGGRHGKGLLGTPTERPLFLMDEIAFPNLEELELRYLYNMEEIWQGPFHTPLASKLRSLKVERCEKILKVFPPLQNLQYLQVLSVRDCGMLQDIFGEEGAKSMDEIVFHQLTSLSLYGLDQLKSFGHATYKMAFPRLTSLSLSGFQQLNSFCKAMDKMAFPQLTSLSLYELPKLKSFCQATDKMVFPQLTSLTLYSLPQLKSLCKGIHVSEYPSLKKLKVSLCGNVEIFASELSNSEESSWKQPLFLVGKVAFPNLEELELSNLHDMKEMWQGQFHTPLASKLRVLKVEECGRILKVFPSPQNLHYLQVLSIRHCFMLQDIFGEEGAKSTDKMVFPELSSLTLFSLANLKSLAQGIHVSEYSSLKKLEVSRCRGVEIFASEFRQPLFLVGKVAFPNLEELELNDLDNMMEIWSGEFHSRPLCKLRVLNVNKCNMISKVFPISLLQDLQNLKVLNVSRCEALEEVFEHGGVFGEVGSAAMLPHLRELKLHKLPKQKHLLKEDSQVAFHDLEIVELTYLADLKEIWGGQFFAKSLCKLRVLNVVYCPKILKVFPINLPQDLQNLELTVQNCEVLEELFELGGASGDVRHTATLQRLRQLKLTRLFKLMHLWKEDSQLSPDFQNLTTLEVRYCGSLTHLLPFAIAKSLVQIKSIIVIDCEMMKEIITIEEGEATEEITFSQLNSLVLNILPNLTSFCRGSNTFSFPSLVEVFIRRCPELKIFSDGILNTPNLNKVLPEDNWVWKGDLNTTIQH